jgi:hypothetical protein
LQGDFVRGKWGGSPGRTAIALGGGRPGRYRVSTRAGACVYRVSTGTGELLETADDDARRRAIAIHDALIAWLTRRYRAPEDQRVVLTALAFEVARRLADEPPAAIPALLALIEQGADKLRTCGH